MSSTIAYALVAVVGLLHIGFFYLEWFQWEMFAKRLFPKADPVFVQRSKVLGQNQAIYNLALALLILVGLTVGDPELKARVALATMGGALFSHLTVLGIEFTDRNGVGDGGSLFAMALVTTAAALVIAYVRRRDLPVVGPALNRLDAMVA